MTLPGDVRNPDSRADVTCSMLALAAGGFAAAIAMSARLVA